MHKYVKINDNAFSFCKKCKAINHRKDEKCRKCGVKLR